MRQAFSLDEDDMGDMIANLKRGPRVFQCGCGRWWERVGANWKATSPPLGGKGLGTPDAAPQGEVKPADHIAERGAEMAEGYKYQQSAGQRPYMTVDECIAKTYRVYLNSQGDIRPIWSIDAGDTSTEISTHGVVLEPGVRSQTGRNIAPALGEPAAWMEVKGHLRIEDGFAVFSPLSPGTQG